MTSKTKAALAAAFTASLLAACGGGGGGGIDGTGTQNVVGGNNGGGISGTGIAYGTVTGYGSVIVNGVHYEDNGVSIIKADDSTVTGDGAGTRTRDALPIGTLVRVDFNGTTAAVGFKVEDSIAGRVENVLDDSRIVVMGQTVRIDDTTTRYEDNVLRTAAGLGLTVGNFVRVQGQVDDKGGLSASLVNRLSSTPTTASAYEVKGTVSNHVPASTTFTVNGLTVNYSGATVDNSMPPSPWNGTVVEVKGSCSNTSGACGTFNATKVEPQNGVSSSSSSSTSKQAEIEGIITSGTSASFTIGNITVNTSGTTVWSGGTPSQDFALGVKIEAHGTLSGNTLTATKVELRDGSRLEGNVSAPVLSNGVLTFKLTGLPLVTVKANASTSASAALGTFTAGTHVRVRGRVAADGTTVVATELEGRSSSTRLELRGMVTGVSGTTLTILGTSVNVNGLSFSDSRGQSSGNSVSITQATFLAAVKAGTTVKLRSNNNGTSWSEAELESD